MADWTQLFDQFQVDRVVELVRDHFKAQDLAGYTPTLQLSTLVDEIEAYLDANGVATPDGQLDLSPLHIHAAFKLYLWVEDLAKRIADHEIASDDADQLKQRWLELIARGAAHRIYDDLPKEAARKAKGGKRKAEVTRSINVDRDRRVHDARACGTPQKTIAIDERMSESQVSRVLSKPRP